MCILWICLRIRPNAKGSSETENLHRLRKVLHFMSPVQLTDALKAHSTMKRNKIIFVFEFSL